jgi:hypothetical protein
MASHSGKELFRQTLSCPAVTAGTSTTFAFAVSKSMSDESSNRRAAGLIGAEDLAQKNPECNQGRVDAVFSGNFRCCQCL